MPVSRQSSKCLEMEIKHCGDCARILCTPSDAAGMSGKDWGREKVWNGRLQMSKTVPNVIRLQRVGV